MFAFFLNQGATLRRLGLLLLGLSLGQANGLAAADTIGVFPAEIQLHVNDQQRLLVHQPLAGGMVRDLSREASFSSDNPTVITVEDGIIRAASEGLAKVRVEVGARVLNVDVAVVPAARDARLSFVGDVLPVLAKAGCAGGSCHAKPQGQNGFSLSVFSFDPKSDYREVVKDQRGRRVFPALPSESLLLKKPTLAVEHEGGKRLEVGSRFYRIIHDWIA